MTQADLERRIRELELKLVEIERSQVVLATGIALARWALPVAMSVAAFVLILVKGG